MNEITLSAKGKINLFLDVTGKRENGYHDIVSVMQSVSLCDYVTVKKTKDGTIVLTSDFDDVVKPEDNIVYKALKLMKESFSLDCGFSAYIEKNIPMAGGMAGGSTDAAAALKAVNILCELGLDTKELMKIGLKLGADVPFCIFEKCAVAKGVGEELEGIEGLKDCSLVLVNPKVSVSTKEIYELVDKECKLATLNVVKVKEALKNSDLKGLKENTGNIMQNVTAGLFPQISDIISRLYELGAELAMMSGSGPTCFGVFSGDVSEKKMKEEFGTYLTFVTKPI